MADISEEELLAKGKLVGGPRPADAATAASEMPSEADILARGKEVKAAAVAPSQPAAPSTPLGPQLLRQLGLTTRYALEGAGGVLDVGAAPIAATLNFLGGTDKFKTAGQNAAQLADLIGLPKPQNATERVIGSATTAGFSAMAPVGLANQVSKTAASPVTRQVASQLAAQPGTQVTASTGGGLVGQVANEAGINPAGSTALNITTTGLLAVGGNRVSNAIGRNFTPEGAAAMALNDKAKAQGVTLTAGDLGSRTARSVENFLQDVPFSGRDKFMQEQALQTKDMLTRAESQMVGQRDAGQDMVKALRDAYKQKTGTAQALYTDVNTQLAKVPGSERIPVPEFAVEAKKFLAQFPKYIESPDVPQSVKNVLQAAKSTNLTSVNYDALRQVRTAIGNEVRAAKDAGKTISGDLSQLYKSVSKDVENWSSGLATTNPDAAQAFSQANRYFVENVLPFKNKQIPQIAKIVNSTTTPDELNVLADNVISSNFRPGKVAKAEAVMNLGGTNAEQAAQRGLLDRAFGVGLDPNTNAGVSPMRFVNTLDLNDPMTAAVMSRPSPVVNGIQDINDIAQATRRSVSAFETPRTGVQNKAVGTLVGLVNPVTTIPTAAGLLAGRAANAALKTDPVKSLLFSDYNPYATAFPLLNAYASQPRK